MRLIFGGWGGYGHERVGEVFAEEACPDLEGFKSGLNPVAFDRFEFDASHKLVECDGIEPAGVVIVNLGFAASPDLAGLLGIERIGRTDDEVSIGFEMAAQVSEELAGVFNVFDDFAGDDGVELLLQVHGLGVGTDDVVTLVPETIDAVFVKVYAYRVGVSPGDFAKEELGESL